MKIPILFFPVTSEWLNVVLFWARAAKSRIFLRDTALFHILYIVNFCFTFLISCYTIMKNTIFIYLAPPRFLLAKRCRKNIIRVSEIAKNFIIQKLWKTKFLPTEASPRFSLEKRCTNKIIRLSEIAKKKFFFRVLSQHRKKFSNLTRKVRQWKKQTLEQKKGGKKL
jgi:hypothetical protein